ncbi:MAG: glycoside hydrolase family 13 protein [Anaerolineaceae bacterium]
MNNHNNMTPDWVKNAVFYQIFPDRFAASAQVVKPGNLEPWDATPTTKGFKGGDLMGVVEKIDYLVDLGITAIYFNPIFQSASNHRYHTHDYYRVDPLLGGDAAFDLLIEEAHKRNIHVVLDGVFNHASRGFFQFNHILECEEKSPYIDWFHIKGFPLHAYEGKINYVAWWEIPGLPKFNTDNPQVRQYIFDVAKYWIDRGADGWRLDVPFEIDDDDFWREFREVVKTANPEAYIVGEIPIVARRWMTGDQFDAVMNYQITQACLGFFGGSQIDRELAEGFMGLETPPKLNAAQFATRAVDLLNYCQREFAHAQLNLLDSHDMPRFLSLVKNDPKRLYLAYLFILTYPGAPCIYYGDEIGMNGGVDPLCRKGFDWDETHWNVELRNGLRELITLRHAMPALRTGDFEPIYTQDDILVYLRKDASDTVLVAMNLGQEAQSLDLGAKPDFEDGTLLQSQLDDRNFTVVDGRLSGISLEPMSAIILA